MRSLNAAFTCALGSILLAACGGSYSSGSGMSPVNCPGNTTQVTVGSGPTGMSFSPNPVNVPVGGTVCWSWTGGLFHNVISGNTTTCTADNAFCSPGAAGCASAPLSGAGTLYMHTFNSPGDFGYFCSSHCRMGMTGTVHVGP